MNIKRRKITAPHFDNTAFIKGYARTLIGRCMNPSQQDVKSLIIMLPKIWKMEDHVVGADPGLGRFQFDFDKFWAAPLFESIENALGEVVEVDLDNCRIKVKVDWFQNLCFETTVDLRGGEFYEGEELLE
ncbi:hypothetical protein Rs2_21200 [Raphanus sativus]|nr:hypothetical protein Rs2_21200 [Raphanus sativus]